MVVSMNDPAEAGAATAATIIETSNERSAAVRIDQLRFCG